MRRLHYLSLLNVVVPKRYIKSAEYKNVKKLTANFKFSVKYYALIIVH